MKSKKVLIQQQTSPTLYTTLFETNIVATLSPIIVGEGSIIPGYRYTTPVNGFDVVSWYNEIGLTSWFDLNSDVITDNTTLYAKWTPAGVTSVCVVAVGGGCGGLGYKNNITVIPGNSYTVYVGGGGNGRSGSNSSSTGLSGGTIILDTSLGSDLPDL